MSMDYLSVTPTKGEPEDEEDAITIGRMIDERNALIAELKARAAPPCDMHDALERSEGQPCPWCDLNTAQERITELTKMVAEARSETADAADKRIADLKRDEAYWRGEYHKLAETPKGLIEDAREQLLVDIEGVGGYKDRIADLERHANERRDMVECEAGTLMDDLVQDGLRFFYLRPKEDKP